MLRGEDVEKKFNFNLNNLIESNISEKREITYKSLCRYLSIPEEQKQSIIASAKEESLRDPHLVGKKKRKSRKIYL